MTFRQLKAKLKGKKKYLIIAGAFGAGALALAGLVKYLKDHATEEDDEVIEIDPEVFVDEIDDEVIEESDEI